jgi:hypothetical protein
LYNRILLRCATEGADFLRCAQEGAELLRCATEGAGSSLRSEVQFLAWDWQYLLFCDVTDLLRLAMEAIIASSLYCFIRLMKYWIEPSVTLFSCRATVFSQKPEKLNVS